MDGRKIKSINRRIPHGVRGLKSWGLIENDYGITSHPSRGAWIEMSSGDYKDMIVTSRISHGVRGLKF